MKIASWDSDSGRTFVIAEAGINHQGDKGLAHRLIEVAADCGADAVKFQMFHTNALVVRRGPTASFLQAFEFPQDTWGDLVEHCQERSILFLASVFDPESLRDYLKFEPAAIKIGSGEMHETNFVRAVANTGRPVILSTGMAMLSEVVEATSVLSRNSALLHCTSAYPCPLPEVNLRAMDALKKLRFAVGYSDHTIGTAVAVAAVARGACIVEKHLTLDTAMPGPDHKASANPKTFEAMVSGIRQMEKVLGDGLKQTMPSEKITRAYCRYRQTAIDDPRRPHRAYGPNGEVLPVRRK